MFYFIVSKNYKYICTYKNYKYEFYINMYYILIKTINIYA